MSKQPARSITGLIVPFGKPGRTSSGRLHFDANSMRFPDDLTRVKLLIEHDQNRAVGYMTHVEATEHGALATFALADTPDAHAALALADARVRDGMSVGVELDDNVAGMLARNPSVSGGTRAAGACREVSLVAIPAFDDARVSDITGTPQNIPAAAAAGTTPTTGAQPMHITTAAYGALTTAAAPSGLTTADAAEPTTAAQPTPPPAPAAPEPVTPAAAPEPATASAPETTPPAAPAQAAYAGNAAIVADQPVYSFDGRGHSLVLDLIASRYDEDDDARARLARFRRAMADDSGSAQERALANLAARTDANGRLSTAAVDVRDETGGTMNITPDGYRPDMLLRAIDSGRPLVSRVRTLPISGPNPFRMPTLGEFDGVDDHEEGTAHVTEGTITVGGQTVTPTAVSGAYRLSRELAESTGPRIDTLVVPEMVKDYRKQSEARAVATLEVVKATPDTYAVDTDAELRAEILAFYLARQETATVAAFGTTAYGTFANLTATDGRALYPWLGPTNANGTVASGLTAMNINGVAGVPAWSVDATDIWLLNGDDVIVFESAPRLFRFEEVEGPGIIKLAIWGYQAAHVTRSQGVRRLSTGADPG